MQSAAFLFSLNMATLFQFGQCANVPIGMCLGWTEFLDRPHVLLVVAWGTRSSSLYEWPFVWDPDSARFQREGAMFCRDGVELAEQLLATSLELTEEEKKRLRELWESGNSQIIKETGFNKKTVARWIQRLEDKGEMKRKERIAKTLR